MGRETATDRRLLLLDEADNVFAVARPIEAGEAIAIEGLTTVLDRKAGVGFKVARCDIANGERILKYGVGIGVATAPILKGELVHSHNLASTYLPSTQMVGEPDPIRES